MKKEEISSWKKVFEKDLDYISDDINDYIDSPAMIIFSGEMGTGKTTLIKHLMPALDFNSPTYSVVNDLGLVVHADFYRIEDIDEIEHLELPIYLEDKELFFVEWGIKYVKEINRYLDEKWNIYEIEITSNEGEKPSRNYILNSLPEL